MNQLTFEQAFYLWLPAKKDKMRNAKNARQIESFYVTYLRDQLGPVRLSDIHEQMVVEVLRPVWIAKYDTGKKLLAYTMHCLKMNDVFLNIEKIRFLLPRRKTVVRHHAALDLNDVPSLCRELWRQGDLIALHILFAILTVSRSLPARAVTQQEIDFGRSVWRCPITKNGDAFVIPLNSSAVRVIKRAVRQSKSEDWIFHQARNPTRHLDENVAVKRLRKITGQRITLHGFRSCFAAWADQPQYEHMIVELCQQHRVLGETAEAYQRNQYLERRRLMMADWGQWCLGKVQVEL